MCSRRWVRNAPEDRRLANAGRAPLCSNSAASPTSSAAARSTPSYASRTASRRTQLIRTRTRNTQRGGMPRGEEGGKDPGALDNDRQFPSTNFTAASYLQMLQAAKNTSGDPRNEKLFLSGWRWLFVSVTGANFHRRKNRCSLVLLHSKCVINFHLLRKITPYVRLSPVFVLIRPKIDYAEIAVWMPAFSSACANAIEISSRSAVPHACAMFAPQLK